MSRISSNYVKQNQQLYEERPDYGTGGHKWTPIVSDIATQNGLTSILDYGCGRETLKANLPANLSWMCRGYDPCIEGLDAEPKRADLVTCTDVLEHIEPECLDEVLDHLRELTGRFCLLVVCTVPAKKTLPDGRNAHLIQEDHRWWLPQLWDRWRMVHFRHYTNDFMFIGDTKS